MKRLSMLVALIALASQDAFPCVFIETSLAETAAKADTIFLGILAGVKRTRDIGDSSEYTFSSVEVFKGLSESAKNISFFIPYRACTGLACRIGDVCLVFGVTDTEGRLRPLAHRTTGSVLSTEGEKLETAQFEQTWNEALDIVRRLSANIPLQEDNEDAAPKLGR